VRTRTVPFHSPKYVLTISSSWNEEVNLCGKKITRLDNFPCNLSTFVTWHLINNLLINRICMTPSSYYEPGWRSRYTDWLRAGRPRVWNSSPGSIKTFLFSTSSRPTLGRIEPPIQWIPRALSLGVKRPGREADHSHPTSAGVKIIWIYTFIFPIRFHGAVS
jgi:hypothetical protein